MVNDVDGKVRNGNTIFSNSIVLKSEATISLENGEAKIQVRINPIIPNACKYNLWH
jgi:hypothetical protein